MNLCPALVELKIKSRECTGRKAAAVSSPFFFFLLSLSARYNAL